MVPGFTATVKLAASETGGISIVEHTFEPGVLIPPHRHTREDEISCVIFGEVANHHVAELKDLNAREFLILSLLAVAVLAVGLWPAPLTDIMEATVQHLVQQIAASKLPL